MNSLSRTVLMITMLGLAPLLSAQSRTPLSAKTLLSWKSIESVNLSPDGRQLIYTTVGPDWQRNLYVKSVWVMSTDGHGQAIPLTVPDKAGYGRISLDRGDAPRWSPDGSHIAFISSREGAPQLWTVDKPGARAKKLTNAPGGVLAFEWSPDSRTIAFTTPSADGASFEVQRSKNAGVAINKMDFSIYYLLNSVLSLQLDNPVALWAIDVASRQASPLVTEVSVSQFAWSPDGKRIALTAHSRTASSFGISDDALIYSLTDKQLKVIARGTGGEDFDHTTGYSSPVWSPDGKQLALFFKDMSKRWQAQPLLGIYDLDSSRFALVPGADQLVLYEPKLNWPKRDRMLLENTSRGTRQLFWLSVADGKLTPFGEATGSQSHYSLSRDGNTMAFVRASTAEPPEIYLAHAPFSSAVRITLLNATLRQASLPKFERIHWKSNDGVQVEGWLGEPPNFGRDRKYPLIVLLHGGPSAVVSDDFKMYWEWPYPNRLAALRGYLVLLPNYRGTGSYSAAFSNPHDLAGEPVDDIVSGIQYLEKQGFVDENKIGIAGHSHGAWLGPQILTTHPKLFRAASFAEGGDDLISNYGQMTGLLDLNVLDYYYGGPPYGNLQGYIAISPIFHVAGMTVPTMVEAGERSLAAQDLEFETALWRCGVPNEFIIYPKTGHNISRPQQEAESMERNLDWFDYWMQDKKDPDPPRQDQYKRWKHTAQEMQKMRDAHPCRVP